MDYPGKDIIDAIDKVISDNADSLESQLQDVGTELLEAIAEMIANLEKNRLGTIKASVANLKAITRFKSQLTNLLMNGEYAALAANLNADMLNITTLTNQYFSTIASEFKVTDFYKEIRRQNIATTLSTLTESGMTAQYVQPITKVLQQSVAGQASSREALATVKEMLSTSGQPTRWAKTYVDDSLNQYSRNYMTAISDDLQIDNYLYSGTAIDSTRAFCKSRVGKIFTREEINGWAKLEWSGKIKGTNAGNIDIYLGGHSCRHRLVPLAASIAKELKNGA